MKTALDRYLYSVKQFLPRAQQDDILRELEENLRSEMDEREAELGRPLNEADREAILARHGSPISVAGRYRRYERRLAIGIELIGPGLFPHYLQWLAIPVAITVALFGAALAAGKRPTLPEFLLPIGIQVAVVTAIFVVLEALQPRYGLLDRWRTPSPPGPELVRRYLHAVRFWLPKQQRDDIVAELGENLRSKIEEREAELGRALDEAELVAILKAHGEPIAVASQYLPRSYLIGPALFPIYRFIVKLVLLGLLVPVYMLIVAPLIVKTSAQPLIAGIQALWSLLMACVFSLGVITLVFAIIERRSQVTASEWDPRRLPPAPRTPSRDEAAPMPWYYAVSSIAISVLFALAWLYIAQPQTAANFDGVRLALAPVWRSLLWPILAVLLGGAVVGITGLLRPEAVRLHSALRLAFNALALILVAVLLMAQSWVEMSAPGRPVAGLEDAIKWTNFGIWIALLALAVIVFVDAVRDGRRVFRRKSMPPVCLAGLVVLVISTLGRA